MLPPGRRCRAAAATVAVGTMRAVSQWSWLEQESPSDAELAAAGCACLRYWDAKEEADFWGVEALQGALMKPSRRDAAWWLLVSLCRNVDPANEEVIGMIGVSGLEHYTDVWGNAAMDQIEPEAKANPVMREALAAVVNHDDRVRPRIQAFLANQA